MLHSIPANDRSTPRIVVSASVLRVRPAAPASCYDRAAIMRAAWLDYRAAFRKGWTGNGFDAKRWSYCLSVAWMIAKVAVEKAAVDAALAARLAAILAAPRVAAVIADPVKRARAETIRAELLALEYSDVPSTGARELSLKAELQSLAA